jgi:hypothetical protein
MQISSQRKKNYQSNEPFMQINATSRSRLRKANDVKEKKEKHMKATTTPSGSYHERWVFSEKKKKCQSSEPSAQINVISNKAD